MQSGRYNELSQRVHRAWITLDLNDARKSIPAEDFAGDSIGEFLIEVFWKKEWNICERYPIVDLQGCLDNCGYSIRKWN